MEGVCEVVAWSCLRACAERQYARTLALAWRLYRYAACRLQGTIKRRASTVACWCAGWLKLGRVATEGWVAGVAQKGPEVLHVGEGSSLRPFGAR